MCAGVGQCVPVTGQCACSVGYSGPACSECSEGFARTTSGLSVCQPVGLYVFVMCARVARILIWDLHVIRFDVGICINFTRTAVTSLTTKCQHHIMIASVFVDTQWSVDVCRVTSAVPADACRFHCRRQTWLRPLATTVCKITVKPVLTVAGRPAPPLAPTAPGLSTVCPE